MADKDKPKKEEKEKKPDLGLLEEDDEFEEFPAEDWNSADEDEKDINVWEDNWDDDNVDDDLSVQLRNELEKFCKNSDGHEPMKK
ncbi:26S proteasome complex subunit SEM1-like [Pecten maximus]|uniref:26S proteasome complex subunit SEM1-like n=1 Tax=Pecten maximus TaxID=6579 RepID=UPI0014588F34|nr:26S proteasome complex subunit SEM1-like [Pecten maximus]